jgi:hypothetical protein
VEFPKDLPLLLEAKDQMLSLNEKLWGSSDKL